MGGRLASSHKELLERIWNNIDEDATCQLAIDLAGIPSPAGDEGALADFVIDWFARQGLDTVRQEVDEGRTNAVGILPGSGEGLSLMLNGHLDTGTPMAHDQLSSPVPAAQKIMQPCIRDGILFGTGMHNMKSGLAAIMMAAAALRNTGVELRGDLIVAGVVGETGRAPVDQYQGRHYRGQGVGTHFLLTHGVISDYAIVADTSHFAIGYAECGVVYAKITTSGRGMYTPYTRRSKDPRQSDNAIIKMTCIIEQLEDWAAEYERRGVCRVRGGEIRPKVSIGSIAGGAPFRASNTPPYCSIYVDVRIPPGKLPIEVRHELRAALEATGIDYRLDLYATQRGYERTGVEPLVESIRKPVEMLTGSPPPLISPAETSMWTDTNLYHEAGIPTVKFGIGAALKESEGGELAGKTRIADSTTVEDLIKATKVYAAVAVDICGIA